MFYFRRENDGSVKIITADADVAKRSEILQNSRESIEDFVFYKDNKVYLRAEYPQYYQEMLGEFEKSKRIKAIRERLTELSQDFTQIQLGAVFKDQEDRKNEFRELHNELRKLLGKEPREYKTTATE